MIELYWTSNESYVSELAIFKVVQILKFFYPSTYESAWFKPLEIINSDFSVLHYFGLFCCSYIFEYFNWQLYYLRSISEFYEYLIVSAIVTKVILLFLVLFWGRCEAGIQRSHIQIFAEAHCGGMNICFYLDTFT